jgi:hypothetical protein
MSPQFDLEGFKELLETLKNQRPGNDYTKEISYCPSWDAGVSVRAEGLALRNFIQSSDFIHVASSPNDVGEPCGSTSHLSTEYYNPQAFELAKLNRKHGGMACDGLSREATSELRMYLQSNGGRLPPDLASLVSA